jgi:hypothetical protein
MHIVVWVVVALLLGLWSLFAWGVHALVSIDLSSLAAVAGALDRVPGAVWFDEWVPGWRELFAASAELLQVTLAWAHGVLPGLVWVAWGLGAACLVLFGLLASGGVALARRLLPKQPNGPEMPQGPQGPQGPAAPGAVNAGSASPP